MHNCEHKAARARVCDVRHGKGPERAGQRAQPAPGGGGGGGKQVVGVQYVRVPRELRRRRLS